MTKNILVIDPYDSKKHAETLQEIYGEQVVVRPFLQSMSPNEIFGLVASLAFEGKSTLPVKKTDDISEEIKYDIIFASAMMVRLKKINLEEIVEKHATEKPTIVIMSSMNDQVPLAKWDVRYLNKDKINMPFRFITEETKKEVHTFLF